MPACGVGEPRFSVGGLEVLDPEGAKGGRGRIGSLHEFTFENAEKS